MATPHRPLQRLARPSNGVSHPVPPTRKDLYSNTTPPESDYVRPKFLRPGAHARTFSIASPTTSVMGSSVSGAGQTPVRRRKRATTFSNEEPGVNRVRSLAEHNTQLPQSTAGRASRLQTQDRPLSSRKSNVWDELDSVKERLNRLKLSTPRVNSDPAPSHQHHTSPHTHTNHQFTSPSSQNHHRYTPPQSQSHHRYTPPQSRSQYQGSPQSQAGSVSSSTEATPPKQSQAAIHLQKILARTKQKGNDVNSLLLERVAQDILALYDSGADVRSVDRACLSLGSYMMQAIDTNGQPKFEISTPATEPFPDRRSSMSVRRYGSGASNINSRKRHSLTFT